MNFSLPYKVASGFFITILLLAIVSYFYFSSTQDFIESSKEVQNSQKVINQLEIVLSLIKDAESGQRGYIITENEEFLEPYYGASKSLEAELLELSLLMKDSSQMKRYESLVPEISSMMARLDFSLDLIRRNEFDSAVSYIVSTTGKKYMDRIRSTVRIMKDNEQERLNFLTAKVEGNARKTFMAVLIGASLISFFLILGLIRIIFEITKKKKAEASLHQSNAELLETQENLKSAYGELEVRVQERTKALAISEERYRSLISATTSIVWMANREGKIVEKVLSWEKYTGQRFEEYKDLGWLEAIHPDDKEAIKKTWGQAQHSNSILIIESRLKRHDGKYRHILLYGVPVLNSDGTIREWIGTITDIHDRKEAEEALIAQKAEAEKAYEQAEVSNTKLKSINQVMETFVYAAAHDLRSPVINLKALLDYINQTEDVNKKLELIQRFGEALKRLDNTIGGLGEIIEIQEADNSAAKPVYFQDILDQVKAEHTSKLIEKDAEIRADFESDPSIVYMESYINSIITNMVTNAIKYAKDDVPLILEISSRREKDIVILTFKDNGIGMDLDRYGKNLFKPFKRFSTKAEGKGIGLHIIKSMIEKNGGSIEVESAVDIGTTFTCYLKEYKITEDNKF